MASLDFATSKGACNLTTDPDPSQIPLASIEKLNAPRIVQWPRYVIGGGGVAYAALVAAALGTGSFEFIDAVPLVPLLGYFAMRIARKLAQDDDDPAVVNFVLAAFSAKMIGTLIRYLVTEIQYNGRSDAIDYHQFGKEYAPLFRRLDFSEVKSFSGTGFMRTFSGVIYSFTGSSAISGALVMSFFAFIGMLLLWRAFRLAIPEGSVRTYSLLVLFLPSFLYWSSALGKEGWSMFGIGVVSYGVACAIAKSPMRGAMLVAVGMVMITFIRPHISLSIFCGVILAAGIGKSRNPGVKASSIRMLVYGALFVMGLILVGQTETFFGVSSLTQETGQTIMVEAEGATSEAGSAFAPVRMNSPVNAPAAIVTVLFRPLPFEVSNLVSLGTAAEGMLILALCCKNWRRLKSIPRCMRNRPYSAYCVGILLSFTYAFSAFSNFGILARQRIQVMPFFLALVCLPVWTREGVISTDEAIDHRDRAVAGPYAEVALPPVIYEETGAGEAFSTKGEPAPNHPAEDPLFDPYARFQNEAEDRRKRNG